MTGNVANDEGIGAIRRPQAQGARIRGEAIHWQLQMGFTFCMVAEQNLGLGKPGTADTIVQKVRHTVHLTRRHLAVPHHVSPNLILGLRTELHQLEFRVSNLEAKLNGDL